ncbi:archaetidylserine decarboxylase [Paenibacillus sp. HB172176]|uniref:archaetidylserine decarboxylase n=1 Tax=Paenibacillus sp. HB172176 TaxID=2493690 RepID=UPI00143C4BD8|nr:archaetidylserine decarboxylase [Paenibacillus sp. HB172176]
MAGSKWVARTLTELSSRKWLSKLAGSIAQSSASRLFIPRFIKLYSIAEQDAEKAASEYRTLNEFFTRRLKKGLRPVHGDENTLTSPVDALITAAGHVSRGILLNIKGQNYTINELLGGSPRAAQYDNGYYFVLYLSPTDYHRIHVPVSGKIMERDHLKGRVYPVNDFGLTHMKRVLSRNERLVTYMTHKHGEAAIVKVGAMNVSSIKYVLPLRDVMAKGDELAYFEFGSTVVLLLEESAFEPRANLAVPSKIRMGEALGEWHSRHEEPQSS